MAFHVRLDLENTSGSPISAQIYKGTVLAVRDPFRRIQNMVVARTTPVSLQPNETRVIDIETWCLNRRFAPPNATPVVFTPLSTLDYQSQDELWDDQAKRR